MKGKNRRLGRDQQPGKVLGGGTERSDSMEHRLRALPRERAVPTRLHERPVARMWSWRRRFSGSASPCSDWPPILFCPCGGPWLRPYPSFGLAGGSPTAATGSRPLLARPRSLSRGPSAIARRTEASRIFPIFEPQPALVHQRERILYFRVGISLRLILAAGGQG